MKFKEYDGMLHYTVQEITNKKENSNYDNDLGLRVLKVNWIFIIFLNNLMF